jgi:hypothetical protein
MDMLENKSSFEPIYSCLFNSLLTKSHVCGIGSSLTDKLMAVNINLFLPSSLFLLCILFFLGLAVSSSVDFDGEQNQDGYDYQDDRC